MKRAKIDLERLMEMVQDDAGEGFCVACREEAYNVEPDARQHKCESCGARAVYGAEELLLFMTVA